MDRAEGTSGPGNDRARDDATGQLGLPHEEDALDSLPEEERRRRGLAAASTFLGRFSQLDVGELREPVERWRRAVSLANRQWFAAEKGVAQAMGTTGRQAEQERLLEQLVAALHRSGWFRSPASIELIGASVASIHYTATLAVLALLLRDQLSGREFALLYSPYASLIAADELGPE